MKNKAFGIVVSVFRYIFLISFSYVLLYPLLYIIVHTFQNPADYFDPTVQWVSKNYTLENLKLGTKVIGFWSGLRSTVLVQLVSAFVQIFSCGVAAYGMARFKFKGKKLANALVLLNILVPSTMILIPSYLNFHDVDFLGILGFIGKNVGKDLTVNLLNTPWVFYLPSLFGVGLQSGLVIFIFVQFFKSFPKELEEAAWMDGLNPFETFFRIVIPCSGEVFLTVTILSVVWHWNEYYLPSTYLTDNYPLAVKVYNAFNTFYTAGYNQFSGETVNAVMAACFLFLLPVLIMYLILQRRFINSVIQTGIKG